MKVCPICRALAFDDAEVCYGCMHRFGGGSVRASLLSSEETWEPDEGIRLLTPEREGFWKKSGSSRTSDADSRGMSARLQLSEKRARSRPPTRREMAEAALSSSAASSSLAEEKERFAHAPLPEKASSFSDAQIPSFASSGEVNSALEHRVRCEPSQKEGSAGLLETERNEPLGTGGWIVRFEMPGQAAREFPLTDETKVSGGEELGSQACSGGDAEGERCGSDTFASFPFVVSIRPERVGSPASSERAAKCTASGSRDANAIDLASAVES